MASSKARTNNRWVSTPNSRRGYADIFGKTLTFTEIQAKVVAEERLTAREQEFYDECMARKAKEES